MAYDPTILASKFACPVCGENPTEVVATPLNQAFGPVVKALKKFQDHVVAVIPGSETRYLVFCKGDKEGHPIEKPLLGKAALGPDASKPGKAKK